MQSLKEHFHVRKESFGLVLQWMHEVTQVPWDSVWCLQNGRLIPSNCWVYFWCKRPLKPRRAPTVFGRTWAPLFKQDKWKFPGNNCAATAAADWCEGSQGGSDPKVALWPLPGIHGESTNWLGLCHSWDSAMPDPKPWTLRSSCSACPCISP